MLLKRLELDNFRQFSGKHVVEFSTDSEKNVTIIMGDNGAGKTTLAQAFLWVLYGDTDFKIKELINREVRNSLGQSDVALVRVQLLVIVDGKDYRITRKQKVSYRAHKYHADSEEFYVSEKNIKTGEWDNFSSTDKSNLFIKKMMPKELARFFIFDGERIKQMSDEIEAGRSNEFSAAVQGLVGLTAMLNANKNFKTLGATQTVISRLHSKIDLQGDARLRTLTKDIEQIDQDLVKVIEEINNLEKQVSFYQGEYIKADNEIAALASQFELEDKMKTYKAQLVGFSNERRDAIRSILDLFSCGSLDYFSKPLVEASLKEIKNTKLLDKGIPHLHADTLKFLLDRGECICGTKIESGSEHAQYIYALLDTVPPKSIGQMVSQYSDQSKARVRSSAAFYNSFFSQITALSKIDERFEEVQNRISDCETLMTDNSQGQVLKAKRAEYQGKFNAEKTKLSLKSDKKSDLHMKKGYKEKDRDALILQDQGNKENTTYLAYAKFVYGKIYDSYKSVEGKVRYELQTEINKVFEEIYDGGISIQLDDKYNIRVTVSDVMASDDELERNMAQNYAIIFAFISGIIKMAKRGETNFGEEGNHIDAEGYPLVMDAPLSAFDKRRINNICKTIPRIAEQVIMFIKDTDGDVAEEKMGSSIGTKWKIVANSQTNSVIQER